MRLLALLLGLGTTVGARAADPMAGMNAWVEGRLSAHSASPAAYGFLFLGGLLASLLPCVYPLYPITASIVKGRAASSGPRWTHPLAYFGGLALVYGLFGLIAGATGGAFNSVLRLPAVNLGISIVFLLLALATCGLVHFPVFGGGQGGNRSPGIPGTFAMGMGAGLLSSSCVGPFVVSILIGIASGGTSGFQPVATLGASAKMLSFGLGLGSTFLMVGLFGARLPKAGPWMTRVQWLLGALILWFAHAYLEKGMSGYGFESGAVRLVFIAALLLLIATYRLQSVEIPSALRTERSLLALAAVVSVLALARGILPTPSVDRGALAGGTTGTPDGPRTEKMGQHVWFLEKSYALAAAKEQGKAVFVDFYGSWCANCKAFEAKAQSDVVLSKALGEAVLLKIRDTDPQFKEWQADPRFPELKVGLPFFVILDAEGSLLYKTSDYTRTDEMMLFLER
jgi:thiol:disulfide interchange protein DsbD